VTQGHLSDGHGLAVSTTSLAATVAYARGLDLLLAASPAAVSMLRRALCADPEFELARVALACVLADGRGQAQHLRREGSAGSVATRRERQHIEVIKLVLSGDRRRAAVLGREHLREFPNDVLVAHMLRSRGLT
jgi:hypothetical protein